MSLSIPFLYITLSLASITLQLAQPPLAPDPAGTDDDGDDDTTLASLLGIDAPPPPPSLEAQPPPPSRTPPLPTMPGGYPYHLFQCKEIQGHLSTQLWNEVVEEVRGDFSPDDVLLPPEPDEEHVVHSPPGLGESLRNLSDVHAQEQSLQELLQLTSPPVVPRPLTASPSPGTETPPSSDPATPTDPSDSSIHIDLNFDDVDTGGGDGILLPEVPRPIRTPSPPHPGDYMLMLVRFGIRQVRPHQRRPGPPPPPGLKPTIMGSTYLADLVSVASDFSAVLHTVGGGVCVRDVPVIVARTEHEAPRSVPS